jgi:hypothetical protein
MKSSHQIAVLLLALCSVAVHAQNLKPGLWEIATQMQGGAGSKNDEMAKAMKELQDLPPEQRKMMEAMMAKQGVQLGSAPGGGMSIKICMTKEMVDRNDMPSQQGDCKHTYSQRSGNTMKFSFVCTKPPSSGEGQFTFTSTEAYKTTMVTKVSGQKTEMQSSGRWLKADCGAVKPLPAAVK